MKARTRAWMGTLVLSVAVLLTAWKGEFGYMAIAATAVAFGIPEMIRLVELWINRKGDCDHDR
jgi:hypothetical protein